MFAAEDISSQLPAPVVMLLCSHGLDSSPSGVISPDQLFLLHFALILVFYLNIKLVPGVSGAHTHLCYWVHYSSVAVGQHSIQTKIILPDHVLK